MDLGLVVRLSPLPEGNPGRLSVDVAYGFAALNSDGAGFTFIDAGAVSPSENRQDRHGVAVRAALVPSERSAARLERWFGRRIGEGMRPLAAVALAADIARFEPRSVPGAPLQPAGGSWRDVQAIGLEIELANALALRGGHLDDRSRGVHGWSWGLGVGLPLGRLAGVRYDFASSPVIAGADRWRHHGVSMWLDPVAIARR
jgi:hypothetical protein